ncbi:hypothetical protein ACFL6I_09340 [candidate division KSB1 bacterium]
MEKIPGEYLKMEIDAFLDQELGAKKEGDFEGLPEEVRRALEAEPEGSVGTTPSEASVETEETAKERVKIEGDIDSLISQANDLISKGDFEGARIAYLKIKEIKRELPQKYKTEDNRIGKNLVELNEKLVRGMDKVLLTDFNNKFNNIKKLLDETYSFIGDGKIKNVEDAVKVEGIYRKIKDLYGALPEGFMEKKILVQDQMLKLYKIIITNKKNLLYDDFKKRSIEITSLMKNIAEDIHNDRLEDASKLFSKATKLYKGLPNGFLKERTELQSKILDIYQKLVLSRESYSHDSFERESAQIKKLFSDTYELIKKNKLKEAWKIYNQIAELYSKLPPASYSRKADLEIEMMELNHLLSLKKDKELLTEIKSKVNEIELLLTTSKNHIKSKEFGRAKETYDDVIDIYNSLPEGFIEQNVAIQSKIRGVYKELLEYMHTPVTTNTTTGDKERYDELLRLLVDVHTHIKRKEFKEIKRKYLRAYKIYHELPLGLIEERKNLYMELYKIYEELKLYTTLTKLTEYAEKQELGKLAEQLDKTSEEYNSLSKKYPQDIELFKYIQAKCLLYLEMLKRKNSQKGAEKKTGAQVKKDIEAVVSRKKELGGKLPLQKDMNYKQ